MASLSKTFTAIAILPLIQAEQLSKDDTLAEILPSLSGSGAASDLHPGGRIHLLRQQATLAEPELVKDAQRRAYSVEGTSITTNPSFLAAAASRSSRVTTSSDDGRRLPGVGEGPTDVPGSVVDWLARHIGKFVPALDGVLPRT